MLDIATTSPALIERPVEADEAAKFFHCSVRSIMAKARDGSIPAHPFGYGPRKRWFFLISELAEHLRSKVNSAPEVVKRDVKKGNTVQ